MSRVGWKGGRFSVDYETAEIYEGLRDWQRWTGDKFNYFRFAYDQSSVDPVYGESNSNNGRIYFGPNLMPALHVIHVEGDNQNGVDGFYYNDEAHITLSFDQINRLGIGAASLITQTQEYLKDRFEYRGKIYRVTNIQILGQIQRKPIIITIDGTQVKPEEMVNDIQFSQYVANIGNIKGVINYAPTVIDQLNLHKETQQVFPVLNGPGAGTGYGFGPYGGGGYGGQLVVGIGYGDGAYGDGFYGGQGITNSGYGRTTYGQDGYGT